MIEVNFVLATEPVDVDKISVGVITVSSDINIDLPRMGATKAGKSFFISNVINLSVLEVC